MDTSAFRYSNLSAFHSKQTIPAENAENQYYFNNKSFRVALNLFTVNL
jgi:hypothetical protein